MRLEMPGDGAFQRRQARQRSRLCRSCRARSWLDQLGARSLRIDAGDRAVLHDGAAADDQFADMTRGRAASAPVAACRYRRAAGRRRCARQSSSRRSAGAPGRIAPSSLHVRHRERPLAKAARSVCSRLTATLKAVADMQKMPQPQFAQCIIVVVERAAVDAERDAATGFDHARDRRDAGAQMQVRAGVDRDGDAALGQQFEFVRPRPDAMRKRQPRRQQTKVIEML